MDKEISQCDICGESVSDLLPCGHLMCDACLEQYMAVGKDPTKRLTFNHLFCPQRCGCFIGDHFVRNKSDDEEEQMAAEVRIMNTVHCLALKRLQEEFPDSFVVAQEPEIQQPIPVLESKIPSKTDSFSWFRLFLVWVFSLLTLRSHAATQSALDESQLLTEESEKKTVEVENPMTEEVANTTHIEEAMRTYAYYKCSNCSEILYGGMVQCEAAGAAAVEDGAEEDEDEVAKVLCNSCFCTGGNAIACETHGTTEMEFKCMFCCHIRPVTFLCGGKDYYCEICHKTPGKITDCDPADCIWNGKHPSGFLSGVKNSRYSLGCLMCRNTGEASAVRLVPVNHATSNEPEDFLREFFRRVEKQEVA